MNPTAFKKDKDKELEEEENCSYQNVEDLFGQILGIERVLLVNRQTESLLDVIEKIAVIPENKLVFVDPVIVNEQPFP